MLLKGTIMKKTLAILMILLLAGFSLFAAVDNEKKPAAINVTSEVAQYSSFGVSLKTISNHSVTSIARFENAVSSSIDREVDMLKLYGNMEVGFLSGINNTKTPISLAITISDLVSGENSVAMEVESSEEIIPGAKDNGFGVLQNARIKIHEKTKGTAALAPAGNYKATITIALTT